MSRHEATEGDEGRPLTEGERNVAVLRMEGKSLREIEDEAGLDHSAIGRILQRPHVAAFIDRCRKDADDSVRRKMAHYSSKAVKVLADIMVDDEAPHAARVAAARTLLPTVTVLEGGERPVGVAVVDHRAKLEAAAQALDDDAIGVTRETTP